MPGLTFDDLPIHENDVISVLIDGANTYTAIRNLEFDIDYLLLSELLGDKFRIAWLGYYTALVDDENERTPLRPLVDWLSYNGYHVVSKQAKVMINKDTGKRRIKGNMDIEIAIDALRCAKFSSHIVLFTGDGDFRCLLEVLQQQGVRVTVVSTIETQPSMVADELRKQADFFIDLEDLRESIAKQSDNLSNDQ